MRERVDARSSQKCLNWTERQAQVPMMSCRCSSRFYPARLICTNRVIRIRSSEKMISVSRQDKLDQAEVSGMSTRRGLTWNVDRANDIVREQLAGCVTLNEFRTRIDHSQKLTRGQRLLLVDQALTLLEMNYVHLPLKRAIHAIDPVRKLQLLKFQVQNTKKTRLPSDMQFHQTMQEIFTSTRDLHTNYLLPSPFSNKIAFLPFLIEEYFEPGDEAPKYLVSRVADVFRYRHFKPGVEVCFWNGIPIRRAIELNGENQAGSNPEARFARGLDRMTIRPMMVSLPPDEDWVVVAFRTPEGRELELRQEWRVLTLEMGEELLLFEHNNKRRMRVRRLGRALSASVDIQKHAINHARKILFAPEALAAGRRAKDENRRIAVAKGMKKTSMPEVFRVRTVNVDRQEFGYLRIFTFAVDDASEFVKEFARLLTLLPQKGLIIDVRGNGGGNINAGERALQLLTPRRIKPELFEFITTPLNLLLSRQRSVDADLSPWANSIAQALLTGTTYSRGIPLTSEEDCNDTGQVYYGPVVLVTDALCYSTTDMFAAGFQDHEIGTILGTNLNTGAGGANVWEHDELLSFMNRRYDAFKPLPADTRMRIALLRSIRVGKNAGSPLEELGVVPDIPYAMTRDDVMFANRDLIRRAAEMLLSKKEVGRVSVRASKQVKSARRRIVVSTQHIARMAAYLDDQSIHIPGLKNGRTEFEVRISTKRLRDLRVEGLSLRGKLVAMCKLKV